MSTHTEPKYDFTTATFWFFRCVGRNPGGAFSIALWQLLAYGVLFGVAMWISIPAMISVMELAATTDDPDPAQVFGVLGPLLAVTPFMVLFAILVALMAQGAWLRLLTRNEVASGIPFRIGADEGRLLLVNLCLIGFAILGYLVVFLVIGLVMALTITINSAAEGALWAALVNGLIWFVAVVGLTAAAIIVMVRFAAAPALAVRQRGFRLFSSFGATHNITGWLVLTYLVLLLIALVGSMIASVVQQMAVLGGAMGTLMPLWTDLQAGVDPDPETVMQVLRDALDSPAVLIAFAVIILVHIVFQIAFEGLWHGVGAYAAVRHDGGLGENEIDITAPEASVGAAPSEG